MLKKLKIVLDIEEGSIEVLKFFKIDKLLKTFEDDDTYDEVITFDKVKEEFPLINDDNKIYYYTAKTDRYLITLNLSTIYIYLTNEVKEEEFISLLKHISSSIRIELQMEGLLDKVILQDVYTKLRKNYFMTISLNNYNGDVLRVNTLNEGIELVNSQYKKAYILSENDLDNLSINDIKYNSMIINSESKEFKSDIFYELEELFEKEKIVYNKLSSFRKYLIDE